LVPHPVAPIELLHPARARAQGRDRGGGPSATHRQPSGSRL